MPTTIYQINCGGGATAPYTADQFFSSNGSLTFTYSDTPILTGLLNPAPLAAYQAVRYVNPTYVFAAPSSSYKIRVHLFDGNSTVAGQRVFNIKINGAIVAANYDIVSLNLANGNTARHARIIEFSGIAPVAGQITVNCEDSVNSAVISAIEYIDSSVADIAAPVIQSVVATVVNGNAVNIVVTDTDDTLVTGRDIEFSLTGATPQAAGGTGGWTNLFANLKQSVYVHASTALTTYVYRARSRDAIPNVSIWSVSNTVSTPDIPRFFRADILFPAVAIDDVLHDGNIWKPPISVGVRKINAHLFTQTDVGAKINAAMAALGANGGEVYIDPSQFSNNRAIYTTPIIVQEKCALVGLRGHLSPNTPAPLQINNFTQPIEYKANTVIRGELFHRDLFKIEHNKNSLNIIQPFNTRGGGNVTNYDSFSLVTKNFQMSDLTLCENPDSMLDFSSTDSALQAGNTQNAIIRNIKLERIHALGLTFGGQGRALNANRFAKNILIEACHFEVVASQMCNIVNGSDVRFVNNHFAYGGYPDYPQQVLTNASFDSATNTITVAADSAPLTGWIVVLSSVQRAPVNALPSNLTDGQYLYVIRLTDNTIKLAATRALALAGTAIDFGATVGASGIQFYLTSNNISNWTFIDLESNNVTDRLLGIIVTGNTFDNRWRMYKLLDGSFVPEDEYKTSMGAVVAFPAKGHCISAGNPGGFTEHASQIIISHNNFMGGRWNTEAYNNVSDALPAMPNSGAIDSGCPSGVFMSDISDFIISDNNFVRTGQSAISINNCRRGLIASNRMQSLGGGGAGAITLIASKANTFIDNKYVGFLTDAVYGGENQTQSNQIDLDATSFNNRFENNEGFTVSDLSGTAVVITTVPQNVRTTAVNTTITANDKTLLVDSTTAARTITLPSAIGRRGEVIVKDWKGTTGTNTITVTAITGQTVDGTLTKIINTAYGKLTFISDGANWSVV